jgi:Protein of unknown function (DUF1064).
MPEKQPISGQKQSKYGNQITEAEGKKFASKKEAARYLSLRQDPEVTDLECQVRLPIRINGILVCTYVADFRYRHNGEVVIEDVKGYRTDTYRLKKKLVKAALGIEIMES